MAEPWLDSLSEDWNSQPRSSSPAPSLPNLVAPSTPTSKSSPGARAKSRIPRPQNGLTSSPAAFVPGRLNKPQPLSSPRRRALKDRTSSEVNIPLRRSSPSFGHDSKPSHLRRNSYPSSSSGASADEFPNGSVQRISPKRGSEKENNTTPEWKKLVLNRRKDCKSQADLFSQTALESMFEQPTPPVEETNAQKKRFILNEDPDTIPSSPPPWPNDYRKSSFASSSIVERHPSRGVLETLEEQDEDSLIGKAVNGYQGDESAISNQQMESQPPGQPHSNEASKFEHNVPHWQYDGPAERDEVTMDHSILPGESQAAESRKASSSVTGGFSPVYITKHNTRDGTVDYRAIDVSDPDAVKQFQEELKNSNQNRQKVPSADQPVPDEKYAASCNVGEFVTVKRGGYSNQGSFRRRPLSPSASSSILPSDSISQVQFRQSFQGAVGDDTNDAESSREKAPQNFLEDIQQAIDEEDEEGEIKAIDQRGGAPVRVNELEEELDIFSGGSETAAGSATQTFNQPTRMILEDSSHVEATDTSEKLIQRPCHNIVAARERVTSFGGRGVATTGRNNLAGLVREQHRRMQAIIGKRKDARYETNNDVCDPSELAKRQILRPRNPTPVQATREVHAPQDTSQDIPSESPSPLEHIEQHEVVSPEPSQEVTRINIRAPISEAAHFRARLLNGLNGSVRKNSVSTQDYVDEAMKIMEFIRSNRQAQSELSSIGTYEEPSLTPQQLDRPPSRDGPSKPWRTKGACDLNSVDPILVDHLKQYAETGDESFMMSSVLRSIALTEENAEELAAEEESINDAKINVPQVEVFDAAANVRIRHDANFGEGKHLEDPANQPCPDSPIKTNSSNRSTNSTSKTVNTATSQKSRNINTISPSKISHLLQPEQAGMRFDTERLTWIKAKKPAMVCDAAKVMASSVATEEDPFQNIPDLSTTEPETTQLQAKKYLEIPATLHAEPHSDLSELFQPQEELSESDFIPNAVPAGHTSQYVKTKDSPQADEDAGMILNSRSTHVSKDHDERSDETEELPIPSPAPPRERRELSVLFSSPPVSRQWDAKGWSFESEKGTPNKSRQTGYQNIHEDIDSSLVLRNTTAKDSNMKVREQSTAFIRRLESQHMTRHLSLSRIDEHHEVSFVDELPNGRSMSLTLSISTPRVAQRTASVPVIPSSGLRHSKFFNSLSSLSEFTFHQNDEEHLQNRCLAQNGNKIAVHDGRPRTALVLTKLVQKLSDAEPDEPYWDWMRSLNLNKKDLDNLHGLDEFCSRLERLTVADNDLSQLNGLPPSLRELIICNNSISDMTAWNHLLNLQYLDVSGNNLESIDGLGRLIHLRKLVLDDNQVSSLEGLFDLDGLISLSVRRNRLECLDFSDSELGQLEILDVSDNHLHTVVGLERLCSLEKLNLTNNQLYSFPCRRSHTETQIQSRLCSLRIANNLLEDLDLSNLPSLQELVADRNRLNEVRGMSHVRHLKTLSLRSQDNAMDAAGLASSFDSFCEIQHLYLSGNHLPAINMMKHFYNLQTLELASTGLQSLPREFGKLAPNIRTLNLNSNSLKSVKALSGNMRMEKLLLAGNRLSRLRKTMSVIESFPGLAEIDLRDNPFSLGFWKSHFNGSDAVTTTLSTLNETGTGALERHPADGQLTAFSVGEDEILDLQPRSDTSSSTHEIMALQNELSRGDAQKDQLHYERLDEDTKLKRRIYELLLASNCTCLRIADGLSFDRRRVLKRDEVWAKLVELGIVQASSNAR